MREQIIYLRGGSGPILVFVQELRLSGDRVAMLINAHTVAVREVRQTDAGNLVSTQNL